MRHLVIAARQSGKTQRLLEMMLEEPSRFTYVAADIGRAMWAFDRAMDILKERGTTWDDSVVARFRQQFQTWEQAADPRWLGSRRREMLVDQVDHILARIFGDIHEATMDPPTRVTHIHHEGNPE